MKDESTMMRKTVWVDNRNITKCQQCEKPFSVRRVCVQVVRVHVCVQWYIGREAGVRTGTCGCRAGQQGHVVLVMTCDMSDRLSQLQHMDVQTYVTYRQNSTLNAVACSACSTISHPF